MTTITTTSAAVSSGQTSQSAAAITSDFTTFLKMLTVQMQNQDPMNPIDSADYAVQLATFSGVEQQVQTNKMLGELAGQFSLMGMAQLAGWVGQEARSTAPVAFNGTAITLQPEPDAGADAAVLVVKNADGDTVARETVPLTDQVYQWVGTDATGAPLPTGQYSLTLESTLKGEVLSTSPVPAYAKITEARRDGSNIILVLQGGVEVAASDVTALRMP